MVDEWEVHLYAIIPSLFLGISILEIEWKGDGH